MSGSDDEQQWNKVKEGATATEIATTIKKYARVSCQPKTQLAQFVLFLDLKLDLRLLLDSMMIFLLAYVVLS